MIERLVVTVDEVIHQPDLTDIDPFAHLEKRAPTTLAEAVEAAEKGAAIAALAACQCHRENTAAMLGVSLRTLHYKMSRYGTPLSRR
ncbi:MAG: helix-turn-helix domain-containing protein [Planctomycetaceae bacterium]